jgi:ADP-ribose pyrophosphatase
VTQFEIESETVHGADTGFLRLRRVHLRNVRADGTRSGPYVCDFMARPKGPDAVVVALWHRAADGSVEVLLRRGLRPPLKLGRHPDEVPIPDEGDYPYLLEVVAGIIEQQDRGESGVLRRAAIEVEEEAGYRVAPKQVEFLGAGVFPSPGSMPEKFWLTMAEISDPDAGEAPQGDGSPMEEGASLSWMPLDAAIAACVRGEIEDAKTELCLRRLRDRLHTIR